MLGRAILALGVLLMVSACTNNQPKGARAPGEERDSNSTATRSRPIEVDEAIAAARTQFALERSYRGFNPKVAGEIEPHLDWQVDKPAVEGVVSINLTTDDEVVLSFRDATGVYCIAYSNASHAGYFEGKVDAVGVTSARDCGMPS